MTKRKRDKRPIQEILDETYMVLIADDFNTTRCADKLGVSTVTIATRVRQLKKMGYEFPKDNECKCFPTNEYRLNYLDNRF